MQPVIRVEMFGGLSVWVDDVPVLDGTGKINKPWQVFCFLVLNRGNPVISSRIIDSIWPDEDLSDPANVLKNAVYVLRREFKAAKDMPESPVLFENGCYVCNPAIRYEVDTDQFEEKAKTNPTAEGALEKLMKATALYDGELLPQLGGEVWVMPLALYYRQLYTMCVTTVCERLYQEARYNDLLETATAANRVDPLEESFYVFTFRALYAMDMHRAIIPAYHKMVRMFSEELGTPPPDEIHKIYTQASEQVDAIEQDIAIIKDDLREVTGENVPVAGPLYCTYDVFKYLYQMVARSSERAGISVAVVLVTLVSSSREMVPAKIMSSSMAQVKSMILGGLLRKTDTMSRYSKSQYIIMLSIDKAGSAAHVVERLRENITPHLLPSGIEPVFATTELEPAG